MSSDHSLPLNTPVVNPKLDDLPITRQLFPPHPTEAIMARLEQSYLRRVTHYDLIVVAWPDRATPADRVWAITQLKSHIYRLRQMLKANGIPRKIVTGDGGYALIYYGVESEAQ